jgi:DNA invertase Pin-like site-specific DNA recombinase
MTVTKIQRRRAPTPPPKRHAALYARCSTSDQTVEAQILALRAYAQARGLEVVREYLDEGESGAKTRRPGLDNRLMHDAHSRAFDVVVVVKLDRLGRSLHHLLTVLGELEALGVDLVSLDDGIDTSTPAGRLFMQIRGAFAEYELALIRERTKAGLAPAVRRGARLGRPAVLDRRGRERALRLRRSGRSIRDIATTLGVSIGTVHAVVRATT